MAKCRGYNFCLFSWLAGILVSILLFNILMDPFGIIGTPPISGVNAKKTEALKQERLIKAVEIIKKQPKAILLGTSRIKYGMDPEYFRQITNIEPYNLALTGGNSYELMRYFQHALYNQPDLKQVVIGLDFISYNYYNLNEPDFDENRLEKSSVRVRDYLQTALTFDGLMMSFDTLQANSFNPNQPGDLLPNGMKNEDAIRYELRGKTTEEIFKYGVYLYLNTSVFYGTYRPAPNYLANLKTIVDTCRERNIELYLFISPAHAVQWETLRAAGLWPEFEEWKRELADIAPVWDFSGYNQVTTEPLKKQMDYYWEPSHFRKEVGNWVLNRIMHYQEDQVPEGFGVLLTPDNIESNLERIREDREIWAQANPDTIKLVDQVKAELNR